MRSTDNNLNNPTSIISIELNKVHDAWKNPIVKTVTQEFYNLLQTKDPHVIYVIYDVYPIRMYYGDLLIERKDNKSKYLMGPADEYGNYIIYMWERIGGSDTIIEICKYKDPQLALDALNRYNKVGRHDSISDSVYVILNSYIDEEISVHDAIVSIISAYGFRDDPRLQELTSSVMPYGMINRNPYREIPIIALEMIKRRAEKDKDSLYKYYYEIYKLMFTFDFFKDDKYHRYIDMRNLAYEVGEICKVFSSYIPVL